MLYLLPLTGDGMNNYEYLKLKFANNLILKN
jgi:hypothetical protein